MTYNLIGKIWEEESAKIWEEENAKIGYDYSVKYSCYLIV
jgi:hypothetical protein